MTGGRDAPNTDAIVIGAGHNGLVAAAMLAGSGLRTVVIERNDRVGGCAVTEERWPGVMIDTAAHGIGPLNPAVLRQLDLEGRGLRLIRPDPCVVSLRGEDPPLTLWRDPKASAEAIRPFSARDAGRWADFCEAMSAAARSLAVLYDSIPPRVAGADRGDLWELARLGARLGRLGRHKALELMRLIPMTIEELLDEWFECEALKGVVGAQGVRGIFQGPMAAGTAFVFLHGLVGGDGVIRSLSWPEGGAGALSDTLASVARDRGVEIRTGSGVTRILTRDGAAIGVALESGEELRAPVIASSAGPGRTFLELIDPLALSPDFVRKVRNIRYRGGVAKVNLVVGELRSLPAGGAVLAVAPDLEYVERAYDDAKYGSVSAAPTLEVLIPTALGPGRAPPGRHVLSVIAQYAPHARRDGAWDDARREELGDTVVSTLDRHLPGLADAVLHREVLTPVDLERRFGLTEGNIHHGEMTLDQVFIGRPVTGWARYRTPIEGLYVCGAGAHPGGGVTGWPGYNAAREIISRRAR